MGGFLSSLVGGESDADGEDSSSGDYSGVTKFHSDARWQLHFNSLKDTNQLLVIDFAASWCGPCRFIEPAVNAMAEKFTDVSFAKIDVDELPEFGVQAMPTFVLLKKGKEVDRVVGAKQDELEKKVAKYRSA
ncbi:Thioredoxin H2 [Linum perenne]